VNIIADEFLRQTVRVAYASADAADWAFGIGRLRSHSLPISCAKLTTDKCSALPFDFVPI
jgi:hypothetical protein